MADEKWADYLISAVRYNKEKTHIEKVKVHVDNGSSVGKASDKTRQDVVDLIKKKKTFLTIYKKDSNENWSKGKDVIIVRVKDEDFIKTESNNKKEDNLENLPEY